MFNDIEISGRTPQFWLSKQLGSTGHTGFLGRRLAFWLRRRWASFAGAADRPALDPDACGAAPAGSRVTPIDRFATHDLGPATVAPADPDCSAPAANAKAPDVLAAA